LERSIRKANLRPKSIRQLNNKAIIYCIKGHDNRVIKRKADKRVQASKVMARRPTGGRLAKTSKQIGNRIQQAEGIKRSPESRIRLRRR